MAAVELFETSLFDDPNLISYWRLEDGNDAKGSNHGTATGATFNAAKFNNGLICDGTDDYLNVPANASLDFGDSHDLTACGWVYITTAKDYAGLFAKVATSRDGAGANQSFIFVIMATGKLQANSAAPNYWVGQSAGSIGTGSWHHAAFVVSSSRVYYYIDGSVDANDYAWSMTDKSQDIFLGSWNTVGPGTYDLNGKLDDWALFDRALTAAEISGLYNGTLSPKAAGAKGSLMLMGVG